MSAVVGRTSEIAQLARALDDARGGRLGVSLVTGEAGVGKTCLVHHIAAGAADAGWRVLVGACLELGATVAYLPFAEMLRDAVRGLSDAERAALLGPGGEVVEPLIGGARWSQAPAVPAAPADTSAELARLQMYESLLQMTERMAARAPLLVVLEDIQWADRPSLDLVSFLVRNLRDSRILLVMTARDSGAGTLPEAVALFIAGLERVVRVGHLALEPFGAQATAAQLADLLGQPAAPELVTSIHQRSGGNPLFVAELLAWHEAGGSWTANAPPRLRDLVAARLAGLPSEAHDVLRLASAAGRMVDDELLAEATGLEAPLVRAGIRAAVSEGLLVPVRASGRDGHAFRHDLVREAVAAELLPGERARLHEAFALALTSGRARVVDEGELAYHWDAAGEAARALQAHIEAGLAARRVFGFETALQHFERALELWDEVPAADDLTAFDRTDLAQAAAAAAAMAGEHARAIELERMVVADLGLDSGDPRVLVALERMRRSMWESGDTAGALAEAERALGVVGAAPSKARAAVLAHLAGFHLYTGDVRRARATSIQALEVASEVGAREERALAGGVLGWSLMYAGRVEEALFLIRTGAAAAEQLGEVRGRGLAADHLSRALEMAGHPDEALATALAGVELCRRSGLSRTYGALLAADATRCLVVLGRVSEAAQQAEDGLAAGPVGPGHVALLAASAIAALEQDRLADAAAALRDARALVGPARDVDVIGWLAVGEIELALRRGDPGRAAALARSVSGTGRGPALLAGSGDDTPATSGPSAPAGASPDAGFAAARPASGIPLVVLGASVGPLLRLAARAIADEVRLVRARGSGGAGGSPDARDPRPSAADRALLGRMIRYLGTHEELRRAFELDLAVAAAELAAAYEVESLDRQAPPDAPAAGDTARAGSGRQAVIAAWREALAVESTRSPRRPAARAYASLRLAEALVLAPGGRGEARDLVRDGLAAAASGGHLALESDLRLLARRARLELDAAPPGDEPPATRPATQAAALGLTERELEVLRLLAQGMTNREIGERLFISPKTASVHVSAILAKLGVDGRVEAALVAQQLGLVEDAPVRP